MKIIFILLAILYLCGCAGNNEKDKKPKPLLNKNTIALKDTIKKVEDNSEPTVKAKPKVHRLFFDYDKVEYYRLAKIFDESSRELHFRSILCEGGNIDSINTDLINELPSMGFVIQELPVTTFAKLNEIFCERGCIAGVKLDCLPDYRDILIFKRHGKISGIAQICFSCGQFIISGTDKFTECFGQNGEFDILRKLLRGQDSIKRTE